MMRRLSFGFAEMKAFVCSSDRRGPGSVKSAVCIDLPITGADLVLLYAIVLWINQQHRFQGVRQLNGVVTRIRI